jgi:polar amino acid transport system permease protein
VNRIIEQYFDLGVMFDPDNFDKVINGFVFTIKLSIIAGILSLIWGLVLAILRQTPGRFSWIARWPAIAYIDVLRGVPALLTILLVSTSLGALAATDPVSGEGAVIPRFIGIPEWFGQPSPFWYGVFAITLTYGAYMAEVYRAGIEAVPGGQMEAARSLGMSYGKAMRYVIIPQAIRKVIPPLLNDYIALMKDTTLVSVIGLIEVVQAGRDIQSVEFNSSSLMLGAILFVLVTIPLARAVDWLIARQQAQTQRGAA